MSFEATTVNGVTKQQVGNIYFYFFPLCTFEAHPDADPAVSYFFQNVRGERYKSYFDDVTDKLGQTDLIAYLDEAANQSIFFSLDAGGGGGGGYIGNTISAANSTAALLGSGATFTGVWESVVNYTMVGVAILGSLATDGTLYFDLSTDGGATFTSVPSSIDDVTFAVPRLLNVVESHVRIRYINGTTAQTGTFSLQTKYSNGQEYELLASVDGFINGETPVTVTRSVITGQDDDDVFHNVRTTRAGDLAAAISDSDLGFHAIVTPGGALKVANQTHLVGEPFGDRALSATRWDIELLNSATQDATGAGQLSMDTGVVADGEVNICTFNVARFIPANYNTTHHAVTIPDGASYAPNNIRSWGAIDTTNATPNGVCYELDSGTWYVCHILNGVKTRVPRVSWNGAGAASFPLNSVTANVYEIEYNAGSIIYRVNGNVMHRSNLLAMPYANDIDFPVGMKNQNINGSTTDVSIKFRAAAIYTLGKGFGTARPVFYTGTGSFATKIGSGLLSKVVFARAGGGGSSATIKIYDDVSAVPASQIGEINIPRDDTIEISYDVVTNLGIFVVIAGSGTLGTTITFD